MPGQEKMDSVMTAPPNRVGSEKTKTVMKGIRALRKAHARGARIATLCSGVFVPARAGLLDGKRATTHWRYADALRAEIPGIEVVPDILYAEDDNILTAAGSAAGIDLCLHIVRSDFGRDVANQVLARAQIMQNEIDRFLAVARGQQH